MEKSQLCEEKHMVKILATPTEIFCFLRHGLARKHLVTNAVLWRPISHTRAAEWGEGYQVWPNWLYLERGWIKNLDVWAVSKQLRFLKHPVSPKGLFLRVEKSFIKFFEAKKFHFPKHKKKFQSDFFFIFWAKKVPSWNIRTKKKFFFLEKM